MTRKNTAWFVVIILAGTLVLYVPVLDGQFSAVDDYKQIFNPTVKNFNVENFKKLIFTNFLNRNHAPMYLSFMFNWALTPGSYKGFVVFNLAWYLATVLVFFYFTRLFFKEAPARLLATLLFAVHSTHADIVAWISARCHLMGMMFFLLTFLAWDKYMLGSGKIKKLKWYFLSLVFAFFAIMNKNIFLGIFAMLFVFDLYRKRRFGWHLFLDKISFFVFGMIPVYILKTSTSYLNKIEIPALGNSIGQTLINDINLIAQYLYNLFIPAFTYIWINIYPISGFYGVSESMNLPLMRVTPLFCAGVLLLFFAASYWAKIKNKIEFPYYFFLMFFIALVPVMNIPPRWIAFAFRYTWIPSVFFCIAFVGVFMYFFKYPNNATKTFLIIIFISMVAGHVFFTRWQVKLWNTQENLVGECVRNYPDSRHCREYLGDIYNRKYGPEKAVYQYAAIDEIITIHSVKRESLAIFKAAEAFEEMKNYKKAKIYYERAAVRGINSPSKLKIINNKIKQYENL